MVLISILQTFNHFTHTYLFFFSFRCLQECAQIFETLQTDYYEEYKTMGLADLAVAVVHPLLKEKLHSWEPLKVCYYSLKKAHDF